MRRVPSRTDSFSIQGQAIAPTASAYYSLAESTSENGLQVLAPASGTIHELNVSEGEYIETGEVLLTLSSDKVLLLRADLPQQFHLIAGEIKDANFRLAYSQGDLLHFGI